MTATDSKGNTFTREGAGTLDFTLRPELRWSVGKPAWNDRNARPQGTLMGVQPGSGDKVPLAGRTVEFSRLPDRTEATSAVTAADGTFTGAPYPVAAVGEEFFGTFTEDSEEAHGTDSTVSRVYEYQPRRVSITAAADKTRAQPGETVTVSGRVVDANAAGAAVGDAPVKVSLGRDGRGSEVGKVVTTAPW
ncbi:hypothetical protein [Streptomyces purpureus]|uniref:hypothetical protein n=1 Tax=Streptomyces purpureus TaxID=1951 RepID=UPI000372F5A2|nr:hypothetical protein [Streptomyces purpureus]